MEDHAQTTKKDFELFKKECAFWIDKLNLRSWRWEVGYDDIGNQYGEAEIFYGARAISVTLSDFLPKDRRAELIAETAFHEVFEAGVMGRVRIMAEQRDYSAIELESEIHAITNRCQSLLLPLRKKKT